ncbi:MAG: sigma-70 family RNA polymerase sigma factor, partial [Pseudomonadales bacterium]|nr:sigma-70 family RNA polymerase sigma factor [Pseudomonadales bacterium]
MNHEYASEVALAQAGDLAAFRALVVRFQDQVTATAFSWVGDFETAKEVAQEVFLEAHLCLHQLDEPAAFPGWLRRIVVKCCDRVTRRRQLVTIDAKLPDEPSSDDSPEQSAQAEEIADRLHLAISALPEQLRLVIALQYFADITGEEIANFLEIPLSTVKKRLHDARRKLRDQGEQLMQKSIEHLKPSATAEFSNETAFFIAMRERNLAEMRVLLAASPALANAEQNWSHDLTHRRVLPFPNRATALISAIELDDMAIFDLLLDAGADPDGRCGCATGESAVWAAALFNRQRHLKRLLDRGADPNVFSASGNTPLHVAAMRGYAEVVSMLLAHGADPSIKDRGVEGQPPLVTATGVSISGRTPAQWARMCGFAGIAEQLEGGSVSPAEADECV